MILRIIFFVEFLRRPRFLRRVLRRHRFVEITLSGGISIQIGRVISGIDNRAESCQSESVRIENRFSISSLAFFFWFLVHTFPPPHRKERKASMVCTKGLPREVYQLEHKQLCYETNESKQVNAKKSHPPFKREPIVELLCFPQNYYVLYPGYPRNVRWLGSPSDHCTDHSVACSNDTESKISHTYPLYYHFTNYHNKDNDFVDSN